MSSRANKYRLEDIKEEIQNLCEEALPLLSPSGKRRAEAYWYAHILCALGGDHGYMGGSMHTLQGSIEEYDEDWEEENYDEDDYDYDEGDYDEDDEDKNSEEDNEGK